MVVAAYTVELDAGETTIVLTCAITGIPVALADHVPPASVVLYTRAPPLMLAYSVAGVVRSIVTENTLSRSAAAIPVLVAVHAVAMPVVERYTPPVAAPPDGVWPYTAT